MKALRLFRCSKDCSLGHWIRSSAVASSDDLGPEGHLLRPVLNLQSLNASKLAFIVGDKSESRRLSTCAAIHKSL
jgi:hypothetical protein